MTSLKTMRALSAALLLTAIPHVNAAELYAQAIGQPPERPSVPAKPPAPPPDTTAAAEEAQGEDLRTRILIGAGVALALGALAGGGGNGGGDVVPEH